MQVEELQQELSHASTSALNEGKKAKDFEDRLDKEKAAREEMEQKYRTLEEELQKKRTQCEPEVYHSLLLLLKILN